MVVNFLAGGTLIFGAGKNNPFSSMQAVAGANKIHFIGRGSKLLRGKAKSAAFIGVLKHIAPGAKASGLLWPLRLPLSLPVRGVSIFHLPSDDLSMGFQEPSGENEDEDG